MKMISPSHGIISLALFILAAAAPAPTPDADFSLLERATDPYAPITVDCPSTSLVRPATGISSKEAKYATARKSKADSALSSWLKKQGPFGDSSLPTLGFSSSGGGYRALLETAGVVQGFDIRDSDVGTSGVFQSLTYEAGLSGGSWFLSSLAGNNWPTVSSLRDGLWEQAFDNSLLVPANLLSVSGLTEYAVVVNEIEAKQDAGYNTTIVDPWGRLLSYQLLYGDDGGAAARLSGLTALSNFTSHNVPYPIMTTTTTFPDQGVCFPTSSGPIFEFHPYEYGSWDKGISAFAKTQYMGTSMKHGEPVDSSQCTEHYDNIGYIFGTSSDVFAGPCGKITPSNNTLDLAGVLEAIVTEAHPAAADDKFGIYPNPFYKYPRASLVKNEKQLALADGGLALQNVPIWPFIQSAKRVDVLIANDNSADTVDNFPNGTEIRQTYLNAKAAGLTKMPFIPNVATFVSEGLNKRATFFGCDEPGTVFIVYLPNVNYSYPSNKPTSKLEYSVAETDGMIANGVEIATQNGNKGWPVCLACAIMNKEGTKLPKKCHACFDKYCYRI